MDYDVLMNKIKAIDENAFLVTIESGDYVDVTECKDDNAEKIEKLLRDICKDGGENIEAVYADSYFYCEYCNENKWSDNGGYTNYMRVVGEVCVCTECLADAEENNTDLADAYFEELINNPRNANEFLSDEFFSERGFFRAGRRVHAVGYYSSNDNIHPEKVLEEEQKDGNDVIFDIIDKNPFECVYRWLVRKNA